ncbi:probable receptor-like protein kinase At5g24010 [Nicotiana tomentosiformis]|uniref:Probable receptor-like protein kinase At5g24010 n=1 Tax=Nicotiana tabacum TaxID=4097 RepID=A0A1S3XJ43_TOBAC|nr:probable receptor-like protein kinase At5g24010 [Nicotiana tomentosiformis]XP_016439869.1 PREDICTED: probable receptor-like protein kinase At5g24010 [Nicotiana tabacum]
MANLLSFFTFLLLSLLPLPSYSMSSSANYTFPQNFFINCGSDSSVPAGMTTFYGDMNSDSVTFSGHSRSAKGSISSGLAAIYETARIFRQDSSYELETDETGFYIVRFHFFPFPDLFNAKFDILASGFLVLSNFTVPSNVTCPVIKEFLLPVKDSKLKISFKPQESSFAFVNAIEAFITPQYFIPESATHITRQGNSNIINKDLSLSALTVIHRINVGGSVITPENDTMRRYWLPDDTYLIIKESAKNHSMFSDSLNYDTEEGGASGYDAPDFVYKTAKEMNIVDETKDNLFNITWHFEVNKNGIFFVRLHFCDIISQERNQTNFNVYMNGVFGQPISPYDIVPKLAAPFYIDFVVDSDGSGFMNISVGPRSESRTKNAFLNGVEIMQLIDEGGSVPDENGQTKNRGLLIIVGATVGGVVAVLILVSAVVILFCLKSRKAKPVESVDWRVVNANGTSSQSRTTVRTSPIGSTTPDMNLGLKIPLAQIVYATDNFDPKFMIGEGGFGKVYKGTLRDGVKVAVKRSEPGHGQGLMEFQTEITVLSKIRHQRLVSLIGYCDERNEMILVYEFMEKGTLREHLYSSNEDVGKSSSRSELSWDQRLEICIGAAEGLQYLHTGLNGPIIHRDIKSTNILLDEHYVAKVADFGLSKSGPLDLTHISTDVKGSFGYLDPDYIRCMQLTQKSDVYSFGVVLLEVLCARPAVNTHLPRDQVNLAEWGLSWQKENQLEKIIDPMLAGKIKPNSLRKFGETIEKCLQEYGTDRPNMVDVLWDLKYALQLQHSAILPQEFHEDSTTDISWQLALPGIPRLPSINVSTSIASASESEVFSQLVIDEAR